MVDIKYINEESLSERKVFRSVKDIINLRYIFIKIFGEMMEVDEFTLYKYRKILPSDMISSPPTFWLNVTPYRHTPAVETVSKNNYLHFPVDL